VGGGENSRTTEVFRGGRWTLLDDLLPIGRAAHDCAVQPDGVVLAIGGASSTGVLAKVDALPLTTWPGRS
jgi:hypothetical protein